MLKTSHLIYVEYNSTDGTVHRSQWMHAPQLRDFIVQYLTHTDRDYRDGYCTDFMRSQFIVNELRPMLGLTCQNANLDFNDPHYYHGFDTYGGRYTVLVHHSKDGCKIKAEQAVLSEGIHTAAPEGAEYVERDEQGLPIYSIGRIYPPAYDPRETGVAATLYLIGGNITIRRIANTAPLTARQWLQMAECITGEHLDYTARGLSAQEYFCLLDTLDDLTVEREESHTLEAMELPVGHGTDLATPLAIALQHPVERELLKLLRTPLPASWLRVLRDRWEVCTTTSGYIVMASKDRPRFAKHHTRYATLYPSLFDEKPTPPLAFKDDEGNFQKRNGRALTIRGNEAMVHVRRTNTRRRVTMFDPSAVTFSL